MLPFESGGMKDKNRSVPTTESPVHLSPRLLRSPRKTQPTLQVTSVGGAEQASTRRMSKQKTTAVGNFTRLTHRAAHIRTATDNDADPAEGPSQAYYASQKPIDTRTIGRNADSVVADDQESPKHTTVLSPLQRIQDILSTFPPFSPTMGPGSPRPTLSTPPQTEVHDTPTPVQDPRPLTPPDFESGSSQHGWQPLRSALDFLRSPRGRKPEVTHNPEPSQDQVLDCIDDNNSIMMYGPLEPDNTSEVEIACSEIVSINGDGEEIRTPQPRYAPLPSESFDEVVVGSPARSPLSRFAPLPFGSIDQVLIGSGASSPQPRFSPFPLESGSGVRSPQPHFPSLPTGSIDQLLTGGGGGGESPVIRWNEGESDAASETTTAVQLSPVAGSARNRPPMKEYRVWLPSPTKISVQTMWWGFRIYLPPPVLDVLNNRQLEAVKRAAIITTALQWLMEHLPIALLPPQVRPGVAVLRHLVPYVGYMGGFIAWSWSAIRSFDKGYGVVLTATWLLPFVLIPGTWEADQVPSQLPSGS